jgi:hypothetical protein
VADASYLNVEGHAWVDRCEERLSRVAFPKKLVHCEHFVEVISWDPVPEEEVRSLQAG